MSSDTFKDAFRNSVSRVSLKELSRNKPYGRVTSIHHLQDVLCSTVEQILKQQDVTFDPDQIREQTKAELARALT